jgi:hypothetical protein
VAVGDVKGFAFFLGLSTIMDMLVTWFYTRPLVILLGRSDRMTAGKSRFGIARGLAVTRGGADVGSGSGSDPGAGGNGSGNGTGTGNGSGSVSGGLIRPGGVPAR